MSCQLSPRSSERNRPAGMAPIHRRFGWCGPPSSRVQIWNSDGAPGVSAAKAGAAISRQVRPSSSERCSFGPKCPSLSAAKITPSSWRNAFVTGFPTKPIRSAVQPARMRSSVNKPFRVATSNRSLIFELPYSLRSTARKRLHDIKFGVWADPARKRTIVRKPLAVGKDTDVLAQPALVVEHIAAHMRLPGDEIVQRFADRRAGRGNRPVGHEVTQVTGEMDFGHRRILSHTN